VSKRRLKHMPQLPHKPTVKKVAIKKRSLGLVEALEREIERLALDDHAGRRCSSNRGMISTKLQGR
jgi:hypothetical protein